MLTYKAMYKFLDGGDVHGEVLDFPGAITAGHSLDEARELLASALQDVAEAALLAGESLPRPDPHASAPESDIEEPIHLLLTATSRVVVTPKASAAAS